MQLDEPPRLALRSVAKGGLKGDPNVSVRSAHMEAPIAPAHCSAPTAWRAASAQARVNALHRRLRIEAP